MLTLRNPQAKINPKARGTRHQPFVLEDVWATFDVVQLWLQEPLTKVELKKLLSCCEQQPLIDWEPMRFDARYRQCIRLLQPSKDALRYLAKIRPTGLLLNYVELALDMITADEAEKARLRRVIDRHLVQRWHGSQRVTNVEDTRYSAQRRSRNQPVLYADRASKVTGQLNCCHLEWRTQGSGAMRAIGISNISALLAFDHVDFWRSRLYLLEFDDVAFVRLGRAYNNRMKRTRRSRPWIKKWRCGFIYDYDRATAGVLWRNFGLHGEYADDIQTSIDQFRGVLPLGPFLQPIRVETVLPNLFALLEGASR